MRLLETVRRLARLEGIRKGMEILARRGAVHLVGVVAQDLRDRAAQLREVVGEVVHGEAQAEARRPVFGVHRHHRTVQRISTDRQLVAEVG